MQVELGETPVDCVCVHHSVLSVGDGFCGVHDVAAGPAGASVTGVTGVVDLAVTVAGNGVDVVGGTSLVMVASGLMASG